MALGLGAEIFSRGFRFLPTPQEAVTYYLPRLVDRKPLHDAVRPIVHHADVYACAPGDLARHFCPLPRTGDRFFFTPSASRKRARAAEARAGSWYAQSTADIKGRGDAKVGELKKLRYKKSGVYTDWLMDEYSCCCSDQEGAVAGESQFVLCKMYVSPRAAPTSAARQESAAFFTLPPPPPPAASVVVVMQPAPTAAPKRPAPPQPAMSPCAKRMRGPVSQQAGGNASLPPPQPLAPPVPTRSPLAAFAPPQPSCAPRRGSTTPSVTQPSPASALPLAPPAPTQSPLAVGRKMCFTPPQCAPRRGSTTSSVTQPSPASAPPLAPPVPTRPAVQLRGSSMPLPTPPQPLSQPKQQVSVVHACHMPRPALPPFQPHVPVLAKQRRRILDPFEAAMLRDEAEEQTVAAAPHPSESPSAAPGLQDDDDDDDGLVKAMEDAMSTSEAEEQTVAASPLPLPSMESPAAALQDESGWDEFAKEIEDSMATAEAETAGGSTMTDDECDQLVSWLEGEMTAAVA